MTTNPRQWFLGNLVGLAEMCGFKLTDNVVALYERLLSPLGYDKVAVAILEIVAERKGNDRFPSVRDIRERIVAPEPDAEQLSIEATNRVVQAISQFGYGRGAEARAFIGDLGWKIVERAGGWVNLCENTTTDQIPALRAQFRELGKALIALGKVGKVDGTGPALPSGPAKVIALAAGIGKQID